MTSREVSVVRTPTSFPLVFLFSCFMVLFDSFMLFVKNIWQYFGRRVGSTADLCTELKTVFDPSAGKALK